MKSILLVCPYSTCPYWKVDAAYDECQYSCHLANDRVAVNVDLPDAIFRPAPSSPSPVNGESIGG
jgi:hypothetical protein